MAHYPQSTSGLAYIGYPVGPNSRGLTLAANASANTKGSYAEWIASTTFASNYIHILQQFPELTTAGLMWLFDVATGAAASETVVVPNIITHNSGGFNANQTIQIPLAIAGSTRVSGRCQCSTGGVDLGVGIVLTNAGATPGAASYVNYGSDTADSTGQVVDPGGTVDTKGSYAQITASTSAITQVITLMFAQTDSTPQTVIWSVDLATGAAASEVVLISDMHTGQIMQTTTGAMRTQGLTFLTYIAASTRIAARASANINTATDRNFDIALLAATAPAESGGGGGGSFAFA